MLKVSQRQGKSKLKASKRQAESKLTASEEPEMRDAAEEPKLQACPKAS